MEIWKDIEGYEGKYQVSNYGNVKSLNYRRKGKERLLKSNQYTNGYLCVMLCNNTRKHYSIHRLVADAFIHNPDNLPCVNHKDENKHNNHVDNLEWCTYEYNSNYGSRNERIRETQLNDPKTSKKVYQYTLDGEFVREWESTKECARNGFNQGNIASCCRGKIKTHRGYIWSYEKLGE